MLGQFLLVLFTMPLMQGLKPITLRLLAINLEGMLLDKDLKGMLPPAFPAPRTSSLSVAGGSAYGSCSTTAASVS
jgi:hypothetical protein|uniref:Uncharacterized protein n=1 Tax=Picea glauca TaxID=3330 RepID=A0A101LYB6_PICGL|nr:hypothetical protein ABT39_MTgene5723 [Picea glauca]QHR90655.1 hypothetical protein Q903MT_gene4680 [Picea sitchensis]